MTDTAANDDPVVPNPTWTGNIRAFFTSGEISCMQGQGIDLSSYDDVKANGQDIYGETASGNMPLGGTPWSANRVQTFQNWMNNDYPMGPREGEEEADSGPPWSGGEPGY
jgi:hypothetical protein